MNSQALPHIRWNLESCSSTQERNSAHHGWAHAPIGSAGGAGGDGGGGGDMVKRSVAPPSIGTARGVASHGGATSVHPKCKSASPSRISKHVRGSARSSKETQYVPSQCGLVPGRSPVFCNEATLPWPSYTHNVDVECPSCTPVALSSDRQAVVRGGLGGGGGDGEGCGGGDAPGAVDVAPLRTRRLSI